MTTLRHLVVWWNLLLSLFCVTRLAWEIHWIFTGTAVLGGVCLVLTVREMIPGAAHSKTLRLPSAKQLSFTVSALAQRISVAGLLGVPVLVFAWPLLEHLVPRFHTLGFPLNLKYLYFTSWTLSLAALVFAVAFLGRGRVRAGVQQFARGFVVFLLAQSAWLIVVVMFTGALTVLRFEAPGQRSMLESLRLRGALETLANPLQHLPGRAAP